MGRESYLLLVVFTVVAVLGIACAGALPQKAEARANFTDFVTKGPNEFYPGGYDRPGPVNLTIQTVGWNTTRIAGNLGIGNGSVRTFDQTSTFDVEYPVKAFMCGDVSTQPWIPGLKTEAPPKEAEAAEAATGSTEGEPAAPAENVTAGKISDSLNRFALQAAGQDTTAGAGNKTYNRTGEGVFNRTRQPASNATNATSAANNTAMNRTQLAEAAEGPVYDAYHPIQYLRPVKDILYEHPLSTSGTAYCQLLGFETPTGELVNVGMKCTGYGY